MRPRSRNIKRYPPNIDVQVVVPYIDDNGDPVATTAVSYQIFDETDTVLQALQADPNFNAGDTDSTITVPAALNVFPPAPVFTPGQMAPDRPQTQMLRVVEVQMTTAAGILVSRSYVAIQQSTVLQCMVDSFQTYEQALLERMQMRPLPGWDVACDRDRISALTEAFFRLQKIGYRIKMSGWGDSPPAGYTLVLPWLNGDWVISPRVWPIITAEWFNLYPQHFRESMKKAQIAEADIILGGDVTSTRRIDGLMSETIGSSSNMYRPGKPVDLPISRQAAKYLTNYIEWRMTVTRS